MKCISTQRNRHIVAEQILCVTVAAKAIVMEKSYMQAQSKSYIFAMPAISMQKKGQKQSEAISMFSSILPCNYLITPTKQNISLT